MRWSEEELKSLEGAIVGAFARGCHDAGITQFCLLSAAGSTANSQLRYVRAMGIHIPRQLADDLQAWRSECEANAKEAFFKGKRKTEVLSPDGFMFERRRGIH
jgi:hypothetical protein